MDSGEYECQVSSEPKLSKTVNLLVQGDDNDSYDYDNKVIMIIIMVMVMVMVMVIMMMTMVIMMMVMVTSLILSSHPVPVLWIEGSPSILAPAGSNISLKCRSHWRKQNEH